MAYDPDNIFAKILRGEIPCNKIYEDAFALAFHDIKPQAAVHALVIPTGQYTDIDDFSANATDAEIAGFWRAVGKVARDLGVAESLGGSGYRVISNAGVNAHQEVPHFHVHIAGGQVLGRMLPR